MPDPIEVEVRNLITLQRQTNQLQRTARAVLRRDLIPEVAASIARHDPSSVAPRYQAGRVGKILAELKKVAAGAFGAVQSEMTTELVILGTAQARWAERLIELLAEAAGTQASIGPGRTMMRRMITSEAMDGLTLGEWIASARDAFTRGATRAVRNAVADGAGADAIRRSVTGEVIRVARRNIDAIARTATTFTTNQAHTAVYDANSDILAGVEFLATLDGRTTQICARWDGTVWPIGSPAIQRPPLHVNCRSQLMPVLDYDGLGIDKPRSGTRASESGQVANQTYEQWFSRLPAGRQDEIIGRTRAKMFRAGRIGFKDMVTRDNRVVPIRDLTN